jgi:hypothetical protein
VYDDIGWPKVDRRAFKSIMAWFFNMVYGSGLRFGGLV